MLSPLTSQLRRIPNACLIALFGVCVIAMAWGNLIHRIHYEHEEEMRRFTRENDGNARAFEEHARRVLNTADQALFYLQKEYHKGGRVTESMSDFMQWADREPSISQLGLADASGAPIASHSRPGAANIAGRDFFRVHVDDPISGLYISKPEWDPGSGDWSFTLSRRLSAPDGSFGGVVTVGLKPRYFSDYYDQLALGANKSMMLIGRDGIIRSYRFNTKTVVGKDLSASPLFQRVKEASSGTYEVKATIDGLTRLSSYRAMQDFPLIAVVAELKDSALAPFAKRQRSYYLTGVFFTLFVACFCAFLIRAEGRTRRQNERIAEELRQREQAAEALREHQDLFAAFLKHLPAVAFVKDMQGSILYSNQACQELFGQAPGRAALVAARLANGEEALVDIQGRERSFDTRRFLVERSGKEPLIGVIAVDISGRRHAQKLEAIGTLAGGVAHDFNNIMTAIIGFCSLLRHKLPPGDESTAYVDHILRASERATHLTRSLLAFGRKQETHLKAVDLNQLFRDIEKLLRRLVSEEVAFETELCSGAVTVMADSGQLEQVLMNLVVNARDAMPAGGVLSVHSEVRTLDQAWVDLNRVGAAGCYGVISVSDTGSGMDQQTLQRIFEPFFTTKGVGQGTGLGLSIVYGIVRDHDGFIHVQSEPGRGSSFRIYLPLVRQLPGEGQTAATGASGAAVEPVPAGLPRGGAETVLLAEDDQQVRSATSDILREFGYRVLEAEDGEQAVQSFRRHAQQVDLVILDVIMPRKNGKEAYEEIRALAPAVKVLFTSGYTADVLSQKGISEEKLHFLPKPVAPDALLRTVRQLLDGEK